MSQHPPKALSPEAFVSFISPVTTESIGRLLHACQTLMSDGHSHIHLAIGSAGGNIIAGLSAYNQLRGLPLSFTTYNVGSVDSVAILPYMLGEQRFADDYTSFLFHGVSWAFGSSGETASSQVTDAFTCIATYEYALTGITASRTLLEPEVIRDLRARSTVLTPDDAIRLRIATGRGSFRIPCGARWWQV